MRLQFILLILLALALFAESVPKKSRKGKKKNPGKKVAKKGRKRPPQRPQRPQLPQPTPPPFHGCISQESENWNRQLKDHIEAKMKVRNNTGTFKALYMCWLAEMAKIAFKFQGLFPGIEAVRYGFKRGTPDSVQFFTNFINQYEKKILAFPPLDAGNQISVLPFGCNWDHAEVHCVFVTESFFDFVLQLAQLGGRSLKKPSDIFSTELFKLMMSA